MKRNTMLLYGILALGLIALLAGCGNNDKALSPETDSVPELTRIIPADGASGIEPQSSIHLKFTMPMDTASVAGNFHFSGGMEMEEWMDSLEQQRGMGGMGMMDMDQMMGWMDDIEHSGNFSWNSSLDSCEFIPDSTMMHNTEYMIFINGEVYGRNGMKMDFDLFDDDAFQHHFQTKP